MANRRQFYEVVSAAVADLIEHGFDSQERLDRWLAELRRAALEALIPQAEIHDYLRQSLERAFERTLSPSALARKHKDISAFTLEQVQPRLRAELNRRILTSANLITLDQKASIERTLQRFAGWASSVPAGGSAIANKRETAEAVRRSIAGLPFEERRVVIDQGHKLAASINDILATDGGAIAMQWQHIVPGAHYDSRPEHLARDGKVFLIRGSWAQKDGLVKLAGHQYLDQVDQPGEKIFCLPGNSRIQFADGVEVAYRRFYDGELSEIITGSGKALRLTLNHPILTVNGWKAAGAVNVGDDVIEIIDHGISPKGMPELNDKEAIPFISEIFRSVSETANPQVVAGHRSQFHGDGTDRNVDVVWATRPLRFCGISSRQKCPKKFRLSMPATAATCIRALEFFFVGGLCAATRLMGRARKLLMLLRGFSHSHQAISEQLSANCSSGAFYTVDDQRSANLVFDRERENTDPRFVFTPQCAIVENDSSLKALFPDVYSKRSQAIPKSCGTESQSWRDVLNGFPFRAQATKVVKIDRVRFSGHVFNLQTKDGYYVAEGIIAHNCSCSGIYLYSLSALPPEMLTEKGHAALKGAAQDAAPNVGQLIRAGHCDLGSPPCH